MLLIKIATLLSTKAKTQSVGCELHLQVFTIIHNVGDKQLVKSTAISSWPAGKRKLQGIQIPYNLAYW